MYLKNLGFSLNEIKNLSEDVINEKKQDLKRQKEHIEQSLRDISFYKKEKGEIKMEKAFINDEKVIGKWRFIGCYTSKENLETGAQEKNINGFIMKEIYFLPNGTGYWVIKNWTKGTIFTYSSVGIKANNYEIENERLVLHLTNFVDSGKKLIAVYEQMTIKVTPRKKLLKLMTLLN